MAQGRTTTSLSSRVLLAIYLVIPGCIAVATIDMLVLGGSLRAQMPAHPDDLVFFTLVFNLPHIVASEVLLVDREYFSRYRAHVGRALLLAVLAVLLLPLLSVRAMNTVLLVITLMHVFGQQTGIVRMLGGPAGAGFRIWRWGTVIVALTVYVPHTPGVGVRVAELSSYAIAGGIGFAALTIVAAKLHRSAATRTSRAYLWANHTMLAAMVGLATAGYGLLALLIPRVVHDVTAYAFYVVHDMNRNRESVRNLAYRVFAAARIPVWTLGPLLSIAGAYAIGNTFAREPTAWIVGMLSVVHYYMEAVTWRRDGLYRRFTPVASPA